MLHRPRPDWVKGYTAPRKKITWPRLVLIHSVTIQTNMIVSGEMVKEQINLRSTSPIPPLVGRNAQDSDAIEPRRGLRPHPGCIGSTPSKQTCGRQCHYTGSHVRRASPPTEDRSEGTRRERERKRV
uniref:Uncharacterized protein n=1 Tax=Zea mays TaxID=4577 RepID=C0PLF9_MAIZE|nr:unknown [Zea mays]